MREKCEEGHCGIVHEACHQQTARSAITALPFK